MKRWSIFSLLLIVALAVTACATPAAPAQPAPTEPPTAVPTVAAPKDIVDTAVAAGSFTTLVAAVQAAGLVDALKGEGPFTVFAPTDEAFAALPKETLDALLADPEALAAILTYHVLAGKVMAADVTDGLSAPTLAGPAVAFTIVDGKPMINDANIVATDVVASNGVIHVIDKVILPPAEEAAVPAEAMDIVDTAVAAGSFNTLVAAVQAAGLVEVLKSEGPFTVFAPTDEAFAALPKETLDALLADPEALAKILTYHVLAGQVMAADVTDGLSGPTVAGPDITFTIVDGKPMINDANIIATDIAASNGVIHVIDKVILPPAEEAAMPDDGMAKDILGTAEAAGSFTTLLAAVKAAGLEEALMGEGPFTVFAPTDEAFAALPKKTLDGLLADPKALAEILTYHVLAGKVMAADVTDGLSAPTLAGPAVAFKIVNGKPIINDANITATDIAASNGVIHVIDKVLVPAAQ